MSPFFPELGLGETDYIGFRCTKCPSILRVAKVEHIGSWKKKRTRILLRCDGCLSDFMVKFMWLEFRHSFFEWCSPTPK